MRKTCALDHDNIVPSHKGLEVFRDSSPFFFFYPFWFCNFKIGSCCSFWILFREYFVIFALHFCLHLHLGLIDFLGKSQKLILSTLLCFAHIWFNLPSIVVYPNLKLDSDPTLSLCIIPSHHSPTHDAVWASFVMIQSNVMDQGLIVKLEAKCPGQEQMVSLCFVGCCSPQANSLTSMSSGWLECTFVRFALVAHSQGGHCLSSIFFSKRENTKCLNDV